MEWPRLIFPLAVSLKRLAAARAHDISYSQFIAGLKRAGIDLDRKSLADIAARDEAGFAALVAAARAASPAGGTAGTSAGASA